MLGQFNRCDAIDVEEFVLFRAHFKSDQLLEILRKTDGFNQTIGDIAGVEAMLFL